MRDAAPSTQARALADMTVLDLDGEPHRLGEFWARRPALLVFVRHFGCIFCRDQIAALKPHVEEIRRRAELVVISSGMPDMARGFAARFGVAFPVYVDPGRLSFRAAGLRRGVLATFHPAGALRAVKAIWNGARQGAVRGDPWQQGGAMVIKPGGAVAWAHRNRDSSDNPPTDEMLAAVQKAGPGAPG